MGILRADRITGLGGANAIKGSTKFDGDLNYQGNYLSIGDSDDFNLGSGDFTIEAWIYASALSTNNFEGIIGQWPASGASANNSWVLEVVAGDLEFYYCHSGATLVGPIQGGSLKENEWTHVMATRSGNTMYMFINGTAHNNSGQSVTHTFNDSTYDVTIGGYIATAAMWNGNISNVRVIKGTALHTSNFTVPTNELVKTSNTVLLACQSSANISQEATGKIITPRRNNNNSSYPSATKFTPNSPVGFSTTSDVGSQYGSTFDGFGSFATSTYMVPPGGNTRERGRGRALFAAGADPSVTSVIDYVHIPSGGNAIVFGNLSAGSKNTGSSLSSVTRGVFAGGRQPSTTNTIEFVTLATTSNTTDFGDLTEARITAGAVSNSTRGVFMAGGTPSVTNVMDFITIATTGNASDFGDVLNAGFKNGGGRSSSTRGILAGGGNPSIQNVIEFITIATTGNGQDFGDLTQASRALGAGEVSNGTRGVLMGAYTDPAYSNVISFVTIASAGDATDFGDISSARGGGGAGCTPTRGILAGGRYSSPSGNENTIDMITIATTGNATDFGDLTDARAFAPSGASDSHGGLS